jgi:hypothetical protein
MNNRINYEMINVKWWYNNDNIEKWRYNNDKIKIVNYDRMMIW